MNLTHIKNKIVFITGGNTGLGFESAKTLAAHGASVYILCRNHTKGEQAVATIKAEHPTARIQLIQMDLSDINGIYTVCNRLNMDDELTHIDVLINNAGVMCLPHFTPTTDGLETQIATNHFGHFALSNFLLDKLRASDDPRVINVASIAAYAQPMVFSQLSNDQSYRPYRSYKLSKLSNILFSHELGKRNPWLKSITVHPGVVFTDIQRDAQLWLKFAFVVMKSLNLSNTIASGIAPILVAATSPKVRSGMYLGPKYLLKGSVTQVPKPRASRSTRKSYQLWELSKDIVQTVINHDGLID